VSAWNSARHTWDVLEQRAYTWQHGVEQGMEREWRAGICEDLA
jgi:hypothetical protein